MADQEYAGKLIGGIGRVKLATNITNAFPLIGETVTLEAVTKWAQKMYFTKRSVPDASSSEIVVSMSSCFPSSSSLFLNLFFISL